MANCGGETELRVQTVFHIRHILVAEQLHQYAWNDRHTALAVIGFFELAACPFGRYMAHILCELGLYEIA